MKVCAKCGVPVRVVRTDVIDPRADKFKCLKCKVVSLRYSEAIKEV